MEFQCNKHLWYTYSIAYLIAGIAGCARLHNEAGAVFAGVAILCVGIWQCFASMIYFKKKVVLTPDGCTISLLSVNKFYPWEDYKTKRYQKVKHNRVGINEGDYVILFTPYFRKKDYAFPLLFCFIFSPFKSFCLSFYPQKRKDIIKMFAPTEEDICTLRGWNIDIQNLPQ